MNENESELAGKNNNDCDWMRWTSERRLSNNEYIRKSQTVCIIQLHEH